MSLRQKEDQQESTRKMKEILRRVGEQVVEPISVDTVVNEEEEAQLEELGKQIEQGKDISIDALPPSYHDAFLRDMANGSLASLVPTWTPWWLSSEEAHNQEIQRHFSPLVREVNEMERNTCTTPCVRVYLSDKSYSDVRLPPRVSPFVSYNSLEVMYLYCFFMRCYNGDEDCLDEIVHSIAQHSRVLSRNVVFESADEVVASLRSDVVLGETVETVETDISIPSLETKNEGDFRTLVFLDVLTILETRHFAIDVLAHLAVMVHTALPKDVAKQRKCLFFTTYFRQMDAESYGLLRSEVVLVVVVYA